MSHDFLSYSRRDQAFVDRLIAELERAAPRVHRRARGRMTTVRPEGPGDRAAIRRVHERAFGRPNEAVLVDALRDAGAHVVSLVAEDDGLVAGHVLFSPVTVGDVGGLGLGPMAVVPERQRLGLGSLLVRHGLAECRRHGHGVVVVLGHSEFYPRFGFVPASTRGLRCEYDAPDDAFLMVELVPGALGAHGGLVHYHPAFARV
jgi:putative acetyltransferase